ncbi:homeobox protein CDX-1a [Alosa sapidissima]|uniref:homeobox protein CDX-1a n=1 Tax=Alosa sapidissima TaxID=34773 RepID=UPI001C088DD8|nr:homeobox protein CDX-1a [Alosa sapidissima]
MYVSYLLEKDPGMNGTAGRHHNLNFNHQNFLPAPQQYTDYSAYHHIPAFHGGDPNHGNLSAGAWNATYPPPREDWSAFCHGAGPLGSNLGPVSLNLRDSSPIVPPEQSLVQSVVTASTAGQLSPDPQRTDPYQWMRKNMAPGNTGKTRTKDKYRVVYSEHQRMELEKEFHYSRYITIRRKAELALGLSLSERQVKIWFQNRRAKERKMTKRTKVQQPQQASTSTPPSPELRHHGNNISTATTSSSSTGFLTDSITMSIKEEF